MGLIATRSRRLTTAVVVVTSMALPGCAREASSVRPPPQATKNIVLISADDMRPGDLRAMPFTRSLARRGVQFTDAINPFSLCCPARAEILTGQYSHTNGVRSNHWPTGGYWALRDQDNMLPVWLQEAGYRTAFVGKYLNDYYSPAPSCDEAWCDYLDDRETQEIPPGWDRWYASVRRAYEYWGVTLRVGVDGEEPTHLESDEYQSYLFADLITEEILPAFGEADEDVDQPFFVWLSSATPHTAPFENTACGKTQDWGNPIPYSPDSSDPYAGDHWRQFADEPLPRHDGFAQAYDETTVSDKAGPMTSSDRLCHQEVIDLYRHRLASLVSLDDAVKQIVTTLKETGEWDNTVLIFTSDNGFSLGEHRAVRKDLPYEQPLRVPMIVSDPDIRNSYEPDARPNVIVRSPYTVTTLDIPATIVGIAGAQPGRELDGIDMTVPRLNPDHGGGDRAVLIESGNGDTDVTPRPSTRMKFVGVRTDRWTWWGWDAQQSSSGLRFNVRGRYDKVFELYDRRSDPAQVENLYGFQRHSIERQLRRMVMRHADCEGQACVWSFSPQGRH